MSTTRAGREAAINTAYDVATHLAERPLTPASLDSVRAHLEAARGVAEGELDGDLDAQITDLMFEAFGTVSGPGDALWPLQVAVARKVAGRSGLTRDELHHALVVDDTRTGPWAGIDAERPALPPPASEGETAEPWDDDAQTAAVPALSEPLTNKQPAPQIEVPEPTSEPESSEEGIIDAEIVEITTSQQRIRGAYGPGIANPNLKRNISGTRQTPSVEISTASPDLADQS